MIKDILKNILTSIQTSPVKASVKLDKGKVENIEVTDTIKFNT